MPGNQRSCHQRQGKGRKILLQPSLLLLLAEGESHGYELMVHLAAFGFDSGGLDSSIVYRDLREMEEMGLIGSLWDENSKGPKRRVYHISNEGLIRLAECMGNLESIQDRITRINSRYQAL